MKWTPALFLLATAAGGLAAEKPAVTREFKALAGTWKLVSVEENGKAHSKDNLPRISFTLHPDGKATVRVPDGEFQTRAVIDPSRQPKTIDIEYLGGRFQGQKQYGIYKVEGNRWTVFSTPPGGQPGDRPKEFGPRTPRGTLVVWERVKEEPKR